MALGTALSVGLVGLKAFMIQLQAFISPGLPFFSIIGLPDASLSEARERVKSACTASGFKWPQTRVTVNMSPASMPKRGSSHDLAIAASVLSASEFIEPDALDNTVLLGELNLDGTVLPINGLLPIMLHMKEHGMNRVVVPRANRDEAELIDGLDVMYVSHLGELIELFGGRANYTVHEIHVDTRRRDLRRAVEKLEHLTRAGMGEYSRRIGELVRSQRGAQAFLVYVKDRIIPLKTEDIAYLYSSNEKDAVCTLKGEHFPFDRTLDAVMAQLPEEGFFRANRQFVISREAIADISVWFGNRLSVNLSVEVPEKVVISKARVPEFKRWISGIR